MTTPELPRALQRPTKAQQQQQQQLHAPPKLANNNHSQQQQQQQAATTPALPVFQPRPRLNGAASAPPPPPPPVRNQPTTNPTHNANHNHQRQPQQPHQQQQHRQPQQPRPQQASQQPQQLPPPPPVSAARVPTAERPVRPASSTHSVGSSPHVSDVYFSREAIDASMGANPVAEAHERQQMCAFIQHTGERLGLPQLAIATAVVFFHRFFACASTSRATDKFAAATACLFLAGKVEETPKRLHSVLPEAHAARYPTLKRLDVNSDEYERLRLLVLATERAVLSAIAFDLTVQHPYTSLLAIIKRLLPADADAHEDFDSAAALSQSSASSMKKSSSGGTQDRRQLAQMAWNFINDSLRTTLCLQFEPKQIALAAVLMASKLTRIALTSPADVATGKPDARPWYETFGARLDTLRAISKEILTIYADMGDHCPAGVAELVAEFSDNPPPTTGKRSSPTLNVTGSPKRATLTELPPPHLLAKKPAAATQPQAPPPPPPTTSSTPANDSNAATTANATTTATAANDRPAAVTTTTTIIAAAETTTVLGVANTTIRLAVASDGAPTLFSKLPIVEEQQQPQPQQEQPPADVPKLLLPAMDAAVDDERALLRRGATDERRTAHNHPSSQRFNPM